MYVKTLIVDTETGNETILVHSWKSIEAAIRALDGDHRTLVVLGVDDAYPHMAIGGGRDNQYIVYATYNNEVFHSLIDLEKPEDRMVQLIVGGQEGDYCANSCVDLHTALQAAKTFAESGTLDKSLVWQDN